MNSPAGLIGADAANAAQVISSWGFVVTPDTLTQMAQDVGEKTLLSRTGGAPTLAVGMAQILSGFLGGQTMMGIWYHFAILFEALFILTTVDAGTRVARFMIQDMVGSVIPAFKRTESWINNLIGSALAVGAWGYFLYQGVIDPMGGINTLWPLFGISNQMLAGIALILCTVILFKMKRERYAWVTILPMIWLLVCTLTGGLQKIWSADPKIGFLAHAAKFEGALADGKIMAPAKSLAEMQRVINNDYVNATMAGLFVAVVVAMAIFGAISLARALRNKAITSAEVGGAVAPIPGAAHV
jgi:carbon starvation protein